MSMRKMHPATVAGIVMIGAIAFCIVFADMIAPNDPLLIDMDARFLRPSAEYPLGTDGFGRCVFSRLVFGSRYSLGIAVAIIFVVMALLVPLASAAAYSGGLADRLFLWTCDVSMALPPIAFVLAIVGVLGDGIPNLVVAGVISYWGWYGRMIRSYARTEAAKAYVIYARMGGASFLGIIGKHILPNIASQLIVLMAIGVGDVVLMVSSFSFLGVGLNADAPEWGAMLNDARSLLVTSPEFALYPGLCVLFAISAFNLLGEGLRKQLSPYGRGSSHE
ncbi:ABC transporter permease [Slackia exigua]|uniref:ABC transporter permease n=1 Tax=Slackia exigua TaxID=84109 RepID=UPI00210A60A7|nr:ABC transporter permease subunit [Slackia exigua]MCQ5091563.1 ABC transporter permease subunit [Slackia exigua]